MIASIESSTVADSQIPAATIALSRGTSRPIRVVLVDDDPDYLEAISGELDDHGFSVQGFVSGACMLAWLTESRNSADILVLDWSLPEKPGIELLAELRAAGVKLPAVFLTGYATPWFEGMAFDGGALDFIDKTRGVSILAKRLRLISAPSLAIVRPPGEQVTQWGALTLKSRTSRAFWNDLDVDLTLGEYKIVSFLASRQEAPATYREIYDCLHYVGFLAGVGEDGFRTNVRSSIKRIRHKFQRIDSTFDSIQNHTGTGYSWVISPSNR
jgi:two-component system response regulator ChvI